MKKCIALVVCRPSILLLLPECLAWSQTKQEPPRLSTCTCTHPEWNEFVSGAGTTPRMCSTNEGTVWFGWDPRSQRT